MKCNCDCECSAVDKYLCLEQDKLITYYKGCNKPAVIGSGLDIHKLIGKLPKPSGSWTLPGHKYIDQYNPLDQQLDENDNPLPGQEPYN